MALEGFAATREQGYQPKDEFIDGIESLFEIALSMKTDFSHISLPFQRILLELWSADLIRWDGVKRRFFITVNGTGKLNPPEC